MDLAGIMAAVKIARAARKEGLPAMATVSRFLRERKVLARRIKNARVMGAWWTVEQLKKEKLELTRKFLRLIYDEF